MDNAIDKRHRFHPWIMGLGRAFVALLPAPLALAVLLAALLACAAPPAQAQVVRFVRGGVVLGAMAPAQVTVDGKPVSAQRLPDGSGWLAETLWRPRAALELAWQESGRVRSARLTAPLAPEALPWLALDWPPHSRWSSREADVVTALAFSPDGNWLAMGSQQGRVSVVAIAPGTRGDAVPGRERWSLERPGRVVRRIAFSLDGRLLLVGEQGPEGRLAAYDVARAGTAPVWTLDSAAELGAAPGNPLAAYGWIDQPGVYALTASPGSVLAAFSRSWPGADGREARARLYRLDAATGAPHWAFPATGPLPRLMTWLAADGAFERVAVPLQWPAGGKPTGAGDWGDAPSRLVIRSAGGGLEMNQAVPALPPAAYAALWRGVALRPDGAALAAATEDGRGFLYRRGHDGSDRAGWRLERALTLVAPVRIGGVIVTATNGTLTATAQRVIFATGPSYAPQGTGAGVQAPPAHPRGNSLYAYDWNGELRWVWKLEGDLQALAADADPSRLAVLQGSDLPLPPGAFQGLAVLRLADEAAAGIAGRVELRFPLEGRAVFDGLALAPQGGWIALAEAPRHVQGDARPLGRSRVWVLR